MRKIIVIAAMPACTSSAHANILERVDNWLLTSDVGQYLVSIVKATGLPVREKFR
ncbi:MAG TPA: hypothetical protein VE092_15945 [Herbaspirillum sp.]|uniref:hypothetical protein n=1 Tax=Herbaspirillum sp. TaxID=1890675 RepID=UPI002D59148A|nr:hypothetical protein [Herbaspirillum sp.]HZG21502.1 hypothetical protein [Herbaspirillum sp.]